MKLILWIFGVAFVLALVAGYVFSFLDEVLTMFLGLLIGVAVIINKIGKGRGYAAAFFLTLFVGYILFLALPLQTQSIWTFLSLQGYGDELSFIAKTGGIRLVTTAIIFSTFFVLTFNAAAGSLGYAIAVLTYKREK